MISHIPNRYTVRDILPPQESGMPRDGYQDCRLHKTAGRRPRWYCKYYVDVLVGPGKTKRMERRKYFAEVGAIGKRELERERDAFKDTVNSQRQQGARESQVPLANLIRTYEATVVPTLKPNTQIMYKSRLHGIEQEFGASRLCDLTTDRIQQWMNGLAETRTKGTLRYFRAVFYSLMELASDYGMAEVRNPVERVRVPAGQRSKVDRRALTVDELRRLLAIVDDETLGNCIRLAAFAGLRIGEIHATAWADVHDGGVWVTKALSQRYREITEPKSEAGRRVQPLPVSLSRPSGALDSDLICPLTYQTIRDHLKAAFGSAGIKVQGTAFHALRRTYATMRRHLASGSIRDAMGHQDERMSNVYVRETWADDLAAGQRMVALVMGDVPGERKM